VKILNPSWPGLTGPSTSLILRGFQGVDARHKAGHDNGENPAVHLKAINER
jgi:hypothetical protein